MMNGSILAGELELLWIIQGGEGEFAISVLKSLDLLPTLVYMYLDACVKEMFPKLKLPSMSL